eukprot:1194706-Prorocentrum_minimum.AAC.6
MVDCSSASTSSSGGGGGGGLVSRGRDAKAPPRVGIIRTNGIISGLAADGGQSALQQAVPKASSRKPSRLELLHRLQAGGTVTDIMHTLHI